MGSAGLAPCAKEEVPQTSPAARIKPHRKVPIKSFIKKSGGDNTPRPDGLQESLRGPRFLDWTRLASHVKQYRLSPFGRQWSPREDFGTQIERLVMKGIKLAVLAAGVLTVSLGAADVKTELTTDKQKSSYFLGANFGRQLKQGNVDVEYDAFLRGVKDAQAGTVGFSETEMAEIGMNFQKSLQAKATERGEKAKKEGVDFLAANKSKEGVKTLTGDSPEKTIQYKVLKEGKGPKAKATDVVSTHYRGTLIDGTEFDSSYKRGEPTEFPVNGVIPGWTLALVNMNVGSKWQVFIPSDMAYGPGGQGPIPPNSVLIFDMELLAIKDANAPQPPK